MDTFYYEPKVICFTGVIGSGKDYQAQKLIKQGYIQINFADALRDMVWQLLGCKPKKYNEYYNFKISYIHFSGEYLTGRQFLQNLGATMRKIDPDFWCNLWFDKVFEELKRGNNICCSDLRFINELKTAISLEQEVFKINNRNAIPEASIIFCDYHSPRYNADDPHDSEKLAQFMLNDNSYNPTMPYPPETTPPLTKQYINWLIKQENRIYGIN